MTDQPIEEHAADPVAPAPSLAKGDFVSAVSTDAQTGIETTLYGLVVASPVDEHVELVWLSAAPALVRVDALTAA